MSIIRRYHQFIKESISIDEHIEKLKDSMDLIESLKDFDLDSSILVALKDTLDSPISISIVAIDKNFPKVINTILDADNTAEEISLVNDCIDYTNSWLEDIIFDRIADNQLIGYVEMINDKNSIKAVMLEIITPDIDQISDVIKNLTYNDKFDFDMLRYRHDDTYMLVFYPYYESNKYKSFTEIHKYSIKNKLINNEGV